MAMLMFIALVAVGFLALGLWVDSRMRLSQVDSVIDGLAKHYGISRQDASSAKRRIKTGRNS